MCHSNMTSLRLVMLNVTHKVLILANTTVSKVVVSG